MPEGPEVKTIAHTLNEALKGETLDSLWHSNLKLRKPFNSVELKKREHQKITKVSCYGKVLFIYAQNKPILMVQLGMTGQLKVEDEKARLLPHTHIRWRLKNNFKELRYVDSRRFGLFDICDEKIKDQVIKTLGPDPFNLEKDEIKPLIANMKRSSRVIKEVLLDQKVISGVGNIYASESLFLAKIHPETKACDIDDKKYFALIKSIKEVLNLAFKNGGTTFSDYVDGNGQKGQNQKSLKVFQRENKPCFLCKTLILRINQSGRSTFYCKNCQAL